MLLFAMWDNPYLFKRISHKSSGQTVIWCIAG